jgi:hypothetical protein
MQPVSWFSTVSVTVILFLQQHTQQQGVSAGTFIGIPAADAVVIGVMMKDRPFFSHEDF